MLWFKIIFVFVTSFFINLSSLSYVQAQNTDFEQARLLNITPVSLQNPETGEFFEALLVTHLEFNYTGAHEQGLILSMGAYELPAPYDHTFFEEFASWYSFIADYLYKQPQAVVIVPDSAFNGSLRAGAIEACAFYLTTSSNLMIQKLGVVSGSLGSRGGLYFIEHPERYPSLAKVLMVDFASPREFALEDLKEENIATIETPFGIYVGVETVDRQSNQDAHALYDAVALYNPGLPQRLKEYTDGRHGFYKIYKDNAVGQDGEAAREDSYYFFQRACER